MAMRLFYEIVNSCFVMFEEQTPMETAMLVNMVLPPCDKLDVLASYDRKH